MISPLLYNICQNEAIEEAEMDKKKISAYSEDQLMARAFGDVVMAKKLQDTFERYNLKFNKRKS